MALFSKVITVAFPTSTGNFDITGFDFDPKLCFFEVTPDTADLATSANDSYQSLGMTDGTNQWCQAANDQNNVGTPNSATRVASNAVCYLAQANIGGMAAAFLVAEIVSFITDGVRINVTTAPASGYKLRVWGIGGSDIDQVQVGNFQAPHNTTPLNITTVGFEPDVLGFMTSELWSASPPQTLAEWTNGFGWDDASSRFGMFGFTFDAGGPTNTITRKTFSDQYSIMVQNQSTITLKAYIQAMLSNGFQVKADTTILVDYFVGYVAIKGTTNFRWQIGTLQLPATDLHQQVNGVGFYPAGGMFMSHHHTSKATSNTAGFDQSLGFAGMEIIPSNGMIGNRSVDNVSPSQSKRTTHGSRILYGIGTGETVTLEQWHDDGFIINCVGMGSQSYYGYIVFAGIEIVLPDIINIGSPTYDGAQLQVDVTQPNLPTVTDDYGLVFSNSDTTPEVGAGGAGNQSIYGIVGGYYVNLTGLVPGQTYYVRTYYMVNGTYVYGPTFTFVVPVPISYPIQFTDNLQSKYQWLVFDTNGNLIADLSGYITNRNFTITRNRPEEISFSINIYTLEQLSQKLKIDPNTILQSGRREIRIFRHGVPLIAGQLIYWEANLGQEVVNCRAKGWLELLSYRIISKSYTSQNEATIARDLVTTTQALTYGDFGLTLGLNPSGTTTLSSKVFENKVVSEALVELSEEDSGFDFEFAWNKKFNLYFPKQGVFRPDVLLTFPGNIKDIRLSQDSSRITNSLLARGRGNGSMQINTIIDDVPSQQNYALRHAIKDLADTDTDQLVQLASSEVFTYKDPLVLREVELNGDAFPRVGSYWVGDVLRFDCKKLNILTNMNGYYRVDRINVALDKDDLEIATLTVSPYVA